MIDWHTRYLQQAAWTRPLREYLFERCGLDGASRVLEVGCGTGAILTEFDKRSFTAHGIDHNLPRLNEARLHAPQAQLLCGDALSLPYAGQAFDMTCCHFLLLWVGDPLRALREMRRVTRPGGYVLALAEPDYLQRVDRPLALAPLGRLQTESLRRQGADPGLGLRLAGLFHQAGIEIVETGPLKAQSNAADGEMEWAVLENDLAGLVTDEELRRWKSIDQRARAQGQRVLFIPTYFAFGRNA
jgi:SAM-dependent methyltransferase